VAGRGPADGPGWRPGARVWGGAGPGVTRRAGPRPVWGPPLTISWRAEVVPIRRPTDQLADAFRARAGRDPQGVWFAPGRVNLIGEHTDYADGFVLPVAIDRGVLVAAAARDDGRLRCWSLQEPDAADLRLEEIGPGKVEGWAAYPAGVAWVLAEAAAGGGPAAGAQPPARGDGPAPGAEPPEAGRKAPAPLRGADLVVDGDVPAGAGLSSSAALECATALALAELSGALGALGPVELAGVARRAEVEVVGMPCGVMDQMVSMLGQPGHALFLDTRTRATEQLPLGLEAAGLRLLVIDTRAKHRLVEGAYAERRASVEAAARILGLPSLRDATPELVEASAADLGDPGRRRARHVVSENARVLETVELLRRGALDRLGPLLEASHASLRDDLEVSCPELDTAVSAAVSSGALGARMTGGGFGGSALALVPGALVDRVSTAVLAAFEVAGFRPPEILPVLVSGGAHRLA
jgi:galactokinase